jgi:polyisoprenoid-binding protein YceI
MKPNLNAFLLFIFFFSSYCYGHNVEFWEADERSSWVIDKENSKINFDVDFLVFSKVKGYVNEFDVSAHLNEENLLDSKFDVAIKSQSIDTHDAEQNEDIHSPEFFDVLNFPFVYFTLEEIQHKKQNRYETKVLVTLKGVDRIANFSMENLGISKDPLTGREILTLKFNGKLNRLDYGMKLSSILETGGIFLGKYIHMTCLFQFVKTE